MKVFKICTGSPPGKHWEYACLNPKDRDGSFLSPRIGNGEPCHDWRHMELYVYNPKAPSPDIFSMALDRILSQKARDCVGQVLEKSGQLLPLAVKRELGTHYLYNCTTVVDALDPATSIWLHYKERNRSVIDAPSFHPKRLDKVTLFMLPRGQMAGLYVVERTGDHRDGEFKALVEHHGLTGLDFYQVWSEEDGLGRPPFYCDQDSAMEHRTADGKPWVFSKPKSPAKPPEPAAKAKKEAAKGKRKLK